MKKIITGYFFRLFRSYEILAVLILFAIASVYVTSVILNYEPNIKLIRTNDGYYVDKDHSVYVDASNVKQYRYESLNVSAYDVTRCNVEPLPQDVFDKIGSEKSINSAWFESKTVLSEILALHVLPSIVTALVIPMLFGRLFSDGSVKNLVACGHSKRKIYLSALIFSFILDTLMTLFNLLVFAGFCIYYEWKPPVYIPLAFTMILVSLLLTFTVSSVVVSVLFASQKRTAALIAGALMLVFVFIPDNFVLDVYQNYNYQPSGDEWEEFDRLVEGHGPDASNFFENKMNITELFVRTYYNGKEIIPAGNTLPVPARAALVAVCYLDPALIVRYQSSDVYILYRSGIFAMNAASSILWIIVAGAVGIRIFNKRELV